MSMIYSGQQIRITLKTGEVMIYRGNAYSISIHEYDPGNEYNIVKVYMCGMDHSSWLFNEIDKINEGGYMSETLK